LCSLRVPASVISGDASSRTAGSPVFMWHYAGENFHEPRSFWRIKGEYNLVSGR
jgi:hypothetical protein